MLYVVFDPWEITQLQAAISWRVYSDTEPAVSSVKYRAWRDTDTPSFVTAVAPTGSAVLDVTGFDGKVFAEVTATDALGNSVTRLTEFDVRNRTRPSVPDWLTFTNFLATSLTLNWGAATVSTTTAAWRVYHVDAAGARTLLATYPVAQTSAVLALATASLNALTVVGVDANGIEADQPGPLLTFTPSSLGPVVTVLPWVVTLTTATVQFTVDDPLASIAWEVFRENESEPVASGTAATVVTVPVSAFQGRLKLQVTVVDTALHMRQVSSEVLVWNVIPRPPRITVQSLSATAIRLRVDAAEDDPATTVYADLSGLGLTLREALPVTHTYTNLTPDTVYTFSARAINPAGLLGQFSAPLNVRTYQTVSTTTPVPGSLASGPVLQQLEVWLQGDLRDYFLQITSDTRIRNPLGKQIAKRPAELYPFLDMVEPIAPKLGKIIRQERPDPESYDASLVIDRAGDTVQKVAIWCERLQYGAVINKVW